MYSESLIKKTYAQVLTLREYAEINTANCTEEFIAFLKSTLVACDGKTTMKMQNISRKMHSSVEEMMLVILDASATSDFKNLKKNVLTLGYEYGCSKYYNSSVSIIRSPIFIELNRRIGSDLVFHMLRCLSVFVKMDSGVFLQVSGCPINEAFWNSYKEVNGKRKRQDDAGASDEDQREDGSKRPRVDNNQLLSRKIFNVVGGDKCRCFPKSHIMESTPCSIKGARALVRSIFLSGSRTRLPIALKSSLSVFVVFLRKHKACPFKVLLAHYCPLVRDRFEEMKKIEEVSHSQVLKFCQEICKSVVPLALWGSSDNRRTFVSNLFQYISLRKGENMALRNVMMGIKTSDCSFIRSDHRIGKKFSLLESKKCNAFLAKFYLWLMNSYFVPLIRNAFTVSESVPRGNYLSYVRKHVWKDAQVGVINEMESSAMITPLLDDEATQLICSGQSLGYAHLRFIPKSSGLRPISNMAAEINPSGDFSKEQRSINQILTNIHSVLTLERERHPEFLRSGVFDYGEIHIKIKAFVNKHSRDNRPLYYVRLDFTKCYDSMRQDKMLEILEEILTDERYYIRQYSEMKQSLGDTVITNHRKNAAPVDDRRSFHTFINDKITERKLRNAVVVDKVKYVVVERAEVMEDLRRHITCNIVKLASQYYLQTSGIAQGSKISPLLCHFYLGHFERSKIPDILSNPDSLLMRWFDDSLLLTYDLQMAQRYLSAILQDDPEYNCKVNMEKCEINFDTMVPSGKEIKKRLSDTWLSWCSLLINKKTLEVMCSYERTKGRQAMLDSLKFDMTKPPGKTIRDSLSYAITTKCNKLFLDITLNSRRTILANLSESFDYYARRFDAFISQLPKEGQNRNPEFFLKGMEKMLSNYYSQARRFIKNSVRKGEVSSMFYHAVSEVLEWKPTRYGKLRELVGGKLESLPPLPRELLQRS